SGLERFPPGKLPLLRPGVHSLVRPHGSEAEPPGEGKPGGRLADPTGGVRPGPARDDRGLPPVLPAPLADRSPADGGCGPDRRSNRLAERHGTAKEAQDEEKG